MKISYVNKAWGPSTGKIILHSSITSSQYDYVLLTPWACVDYGCTFPLRILSARLLYLSKQLHNREKYNIFYTHNFSYWHFSVLNQLCLTRKRNYVIFIYILRFIYGYVILHRKYILYFSDNKLQLKCTIQLFTNCVYVFLWIQI